MRRSATRYEASGAGPRAGGSTSGVAVADSIRQADVAAAGPMTISEYGTAAISSLEGMLDRISFGPRFGDLN
jgi:hypothetical protein